MYGFDGKETECLRRRFCNLSKEETGWANADEFLRWARDSGYEKNLHMGRHDETLPHGPGNSFWMTRDLWQTRQRFLKKMKESCPFCRDCEKTCSLSGKGCTEWQQYFVKNWNKHICIAKPVVKEDPNVRKCFRYEHPDLVREGIVFEGSGSM